MATGAPPRSRLGPGQLEREVRLRGPSKLRVDQGYSQELCDLVAFTLVVDPNKRPSMEQILEHPYLKDTEHLYPTRSLKGFVQEFENWAEAGGQRHSLFNNFGAASAKLADDIISKPEWRFSTLESTEIMEDLPANIEEQLATDFINNDHHLASRFDQVADMTSTQAQEDAFNSYNASEPSSPYLTESDFTPSGSPKAYQNTTLSVDTTSASVTDANKVVRGEKQLGRLFDPHKSLYNYSGLNSSKSDLPLRNSTPDSSAAGNKGKEIEANMMGTSNSGNIALADPATLKAKRKDRPPTMAWEFPSGLTGEVAEESRAINKRPPTMGWEFPEGEPNNGANESQAPLPSRVSNQSSGTWNLDNEDDYGAPSDEAYEDPYTSPYTAPQTTNYAPMLQTPRDMAPGHANPQRARQTLDLDTYGATTELDAGSDAMRKARQTLDLDALMSDMELGSAHSAASTAPSSIQGTGPRHDADTLTPDTASLSTSFALTPPYATTTTDSATDGTRAPFLPPDPMPPSAEAMAHNASPEVKEAELVRLATELGQWLEYNEFNWNQIHGEMETYQAKLEVEEVANGRRGS